MPSSPRMSLYPTVRNWMIRTTFARDSLLSSLVVAMAPKRERFLQADLTSQVIARRTRAQMRSSSLQSGLNEHGRRLNS